MFFPRPGLPLTRVHMCHIVRGKYVPVARARNTLPVASEHGTGSRKAADRNGAEGSRAEEEVWSSFFSKSFPGKVFLTRHPFASSPAAWTGPVLTAGYFTVGSRRSSGRVAKVLHSSPYPITWANGHPTAALCWLTKSMQHQTLGSVHPEEGEGWGGGLGVRG